VIRRKLRVTKTKAINPARQPQGDFPDMANIPASDSPSTNGSASASNQQLTRPLPATHQELLARRKHRRNLTLTDLIQPHHEALWDIPAYQGWWKAHTDAEAISGKREVDDYEIAKMIRERATDVNDNAVMNEKPLVIAQAVRRMARRYEGLHRDDRALPTAAE